MKIDWIMGFLLFAALVCHYWPGNETGESEE